MISIITPIYDLESHLSNFIDLVHKLENKLKKDSRNGLIKEIIIINNNPKKDIKKFMKSLPALSRLKIIQNKKNVGYGAACNQGIKRAKARYILILNPDVKINAKALKEIVKIAKQNKKANIISCKLLNGDGSLQLSCKRFPTFRALLARRIRFLFAYIFKKQLNRYEMKDYDHKSPRKVDWVSGAFMLMKNKYYFDERYFMYFEDADICRRIKGVYYYPSVSAIHKAERGSTRSIRMFLYHFVSMVRYFYKFSNKSFFNR